MCFVNVECLGLSSAVVEENHEDNWNSFKIINYIQKFQNLTDILNSKFNSFQNFEFYDSKT